MTTRQPLRTATFKPEAAQGYLTRLGSGRGFRMPAENARPTPTIGPHCPDHRVKET